MDTLDSQAVRVTAILNAMEKDGKVNVFPECVYKTINVAILPEYRMIAVYFDYAIGEEFSAKAKLTYFTSAVAFDYRDAKRCSDEEIKRLLVGVFPKVKNSFVVVQLYSEIPVERVIPLIDQGEETDECPQPTVVQPPR